MFLCFKCIFNSADWGANLLWFGSSVQGANLSAMLGRRGQEVQCSQSSLVCSSVWKCQSGRSKVVQFSIIKCSLGRFRMPGVCRFFVHSIKPPLEISKGNRGDVFKGSISSRSQALVATRWKAIATRWRPLLGS